jgi:hypothetical protein
MEWPLNPKDVTTRRIAASTKVCEGPCLLVGMVAAPYTTSGYVTVHDGVDANAEGKVTLDVTKGTTLPYEPGVPCYLSQGLYVAFTTFDGYVTVRFVKLQQGE